MARPSQRSRWTVGLVVGVLLGLFSGGNVPAIVGLAAVAAAVAAIRAGDVALAGAAIGFGFVVLLLVALFLDGSADGHPVWLQVAGAIGAAGVIGGIAATAMAARAARGRGR